MNASAGLTWDLLSTDDMDKELAQIEDCEEGPDRDRVLAAKSKLWGISCETLQKLLIERGFSAPPNAEQEAESKRAARFSLEATRIDFALDDDPAPREFLIPDFLPAQETGLLVATGGTGKGHLQIMLALTRALGLPFGPYEAPKPCGTVFVSMEDDRGEFHRRLAAALRRMWASNRSEGESFEAWKSERAKCLVSRIRFVDLRGLTGVYLGPDLRDEIASQIENTAEPGLVLIDPLARILPPDTSLNDQAGAGAVLNELDAIRNATNCTVITAHHSNKAALRDGGELKGSAATGSGLLTDLSRWTLNLKSLSQKEIGNYGLEEDRRYVEAAVTKSNYAPVPTQSLIFRREDGGSLMHVKARDKRDTAVEKAFGALLAAGDWIEKSRWEGLCREPEHGKLSRDAMADARSALRSRGSLEVLELRGKAKRNRATLFGPSRELRPSTWPPVPTAKEWFDGAS